MFYVTCRILILEEYPCFKFYSDVIAQLNLRRGIQDGRLPFFMRYLGGRREHEQRVNLLALRYRKLESNFNEFLFYVSLAREKLNQS